MSTTLHSRYLIAALPLALLPLAACSDRPLSPGVGRSITAENPFVISGASSVELTVDNLSDIDFVDWS